jgi:hypothetical protein
MLLRNVPEGRHDRSLARSAWESATPKEPSRRDGMIRGRCAHLFYSTKPLGLAAPDHTVPSGTVLSRDAFPGTSCQATIVLSLRDERAEISQQPLAKFTAPDLDSATSGERCAQRADPAASKSGLVLATKAVHRKHFGIRHCRHLPRSFPAGDHLTDSNQHTLAYRSLIVASTRSGSSPHHRWDRSSHSTAPR